MIHYAQKNCAPLGTATAWRLPSVFNYLRQTGNHIKKINKYIKSEPGPAAMICSPWRDGEIPPKCHQAGIKSRLAGKLTCANVNYFLFIFPFFEGSAAAAGWGRSEESIRLIRFHCCLETDESRVVCLRISTLFAIRSTISREQCTHKKEKCGKKEKRKGDICSCGASAKHQLAAVAARADCRGL